MFYIRKYDYINHQTFTQMFGIAVWIKGCWFDICFGCYTTKQQRDSLYNNIIQIGLAYTISQALPAQVLDVQLEPPNETDALVPVY